MASDLPISDVRPFALDEEGLWRTPLSSAQRKALSAAFTADEELRSEVEALLRRLCGEVRAVFVQAFAGELAAAEPSARPVGAVLPALQETIGLPPKTRAKDIRVSRRRDSI
jgi:hypothetical protein